MTRVKICGITNPDDAARAVRAGADALGFLFSESPRQLSPERASEIAAALPPFVATVGVFVNEPLERVLGVARAVGLDYVQLHGDEDPDFVAAAAGDVKVIKAVSVESERSLEGLHRFSRASAFLLDAYVKGMRGGTGQTFNWRLLRDKRDELPRPVILAGGLHADNVEEAIAVCRPYGVDVSSGVEESPGVKDPVKVERFVATVRRADDGTSGNVWDIRRDVRP